jgi:hypothetical protein
MRKKRFKGIDELYGSYQEEYDIDFESDDVLHERVLRNDYTQMYSLKDISKWVEYGVRQGVVRRSSDKEDIEMIMKWIDLLNKKKVAL